MLPIQLRVVIPASSRRMVMNFRTLDLNLLRVFDVVMTERHVTRAAERLAMTQPAVSNALRRLRDALADELFIPVPSGVAPTRRAQTLWPEVGQALKALRDAIEPQDFDPLREERAFTVAMADATAAVIVPLLMEQWHKTGTRSSVEVIGLDTRDPRGPLENGTADAALGFFPDVAGETGPGCPSTLCVRPLYSCEYVAVMRRDHPLARKRALSLDDYCAAEHVRITFSNRAPCYADQALAQLGRSRRVVLSVRHFAIAGRAISRSDLLAVLPQSFVPATGYEPELMTRKLPFPLPRVDVRLMWHQRHVHDAGQTWFRATLAQAAQRVAGEWVEPALVHGATASVAQ
jgi:DNA-binding transcriptional LysR family regulator